MSHYWLLCTRAVLLAGLLVLVPGLCFSQENKNELRSTLPLVVSAEWLYSQLDNPEIVILDARTARAYEKEHIAGAVSVPSSVTYRSDNSARVVSQAVAESLFGIFGIDNNSLIVVYDDGVYLDAARVFWTLELYGHTEIALLDGGFKGWTKPGYKVSKRVPDIKKKEYRASIQINAMATRLQTLLAIDNPNIRLVDAREYVEYIGLESTERRAGHIPTAINVPKFENLQVQSGIPHVKSLEKLGELYESLPSDDQIITYCRTGREASLNYFALRMMDRNVRLYDGGWADWANVPDLPIVQGY